MRELLCFAASMYVFAILGRVVLSWFPASRGGVVATLSQLLVRITDPVLVPVRRVLPSLGSLDLSPFVVLLFLQIVVINLILGCRGAL
jgi:YggT family protein